MKHITALQMAAFKDELQKEAGIASNIGKAITKRVGWGAPARVGASLSEWAERSPYLARIAGGAALGAGGGAAASEPGSRLHGALGGAMIGAGGMGGLMLTSKAGRAATKKTFSDFGKRQRYAFTGGGLGKAPQDRVAKAKEIGLLREAPTAKSFTHAKTGKLDSKGLAKAQRMHALEEEAVTKGYSSIPGMARGLASKDAPNVLRSAWKRGGTLGKLFAGLGAYDTVKGFAGKPQEGGPGRLEKGFKGLGSTLGWMLAPGSLLASSVVGSGAGALGGLAGRAGDRGVSKIRGRVPASTGHVRRPMQYGGR